MDQNYPCQKVLMSADEIAFFPFLQFPPPPPAAAAPPPPPPSHLNIRHKKKKSICDTAIVIASQFTPFLSLDTHSCA